MKLLGALGVCGLLLAIVAPAAFPAGAKTTRVSVSSHGAQANGQSGRQSVSADGRFVAFDSSASNLVRGDTNGQERRDVFVRDRRTGKTTRVSVSSSGAEAHGYSSNPSISPSGRFVAFESSARNLVRGDTNHSDDVFVHDRRTGKTRRVSVSSSGAQADGYSFEPSISASGRFVAFASDARNLVRGDTNGYTGADVFVHDRRTGKTRRVSVSSSGAQARGGISVDPSISASGRFVAFTSWARNLVRGDTNHHTDVFVHDRRTGKTTRVSVSSSGAQAHGNSFEPSISASGRFVAFASWAPKLVAHDTNGFIDVFVRDRRTGKTRLVSVSSGGAAGKGGSFNPSISASGRLVSFESEATNLVRDDTNDDVDAFFRNRKTDKTRRVSVSSTQAQGNGDSFFPSISADGRFVAFESFASNLVSGDTNELEDVFVRGPLR